MVEMGAQSNSQSVVARQFALPKRTLCPTYPNPVPPSIKKKKRILVPCPWKRKRAYSSQDVTAPQGEWTNAEQSECSHSQAVLTSQPPSGKRRLWRGAPSAEAAIRDDWINVPLSAIPPLQYGLVSGRPPGSPTPWDTKLWCLPPANYPTWNDAWNDCPSTPSATRIAYKLIVYSKSGCYKLPVFTA